MIWEIYSNNCETTGILENGLIERIRNKDISPDVFVKNSTMDDWVQLKNTEIWKTTQQEQLQKNQEFERIQEAKCLKDRFKNKTGLAYFSLGIAILTFFIMMFLSGVPDEESVNSYFYIYNDDFIRGWIIVCSISGVIALVLALITLFNDRLDILKEFYPDDYFDYIFFGRRLAIAAILVLLMGLVILGLVRQGVFHPLFFSEEYLKEAFLKEAFH